MAITSANAVINLLPQADMMPKAQEPQKKTEGRSWADMKATAANNTYAGKGGTKS